MIAFTKVDGKISKTMATNTAIGFLVAILFALEQSLPALDAVVPPATYVWLSILIPVINMAIRQVTEKPMQ